MMCQPKRRRWVVLRDADFADGDAEADVSERLGHGRAGRTARWAFSFARIPSFTIV
jgi:hypothetical protein